MIQITEDNAWEACLALWERLSETPDTEIRDIEEFKDNVLYELGYGGAKHGCPFCGVYYDDKKPCPMCPLGLKDGQPLIKGLWRANCIWNSPYGAWDDLADEGMHHQDEALDFYIYLLELKFQEV